MINFIKRGTSDSGCCQHNVVEFFSTVKFILCLLITDVYRVKLDLKCYSIGSPPYSATHVQYRNTVEPCVQKKFIHGCYVVVVFLVNLTVVFIYFPIHCFNLI